VPGVSVAVAIGSRVLTATDGVVNSRTGVQVTPDAVFQVQSVTKIVTACLVMQLVDDGLVGLDDPVRAHLPAFRTADVAASELITVRHLLTHTGGFEGDLWQPTTSGADALERFVHDLVPAARQHSAPGRRFSYCNAGYGTLGRLVEVLRGDTFEQVVRSRLAGPLGVEELAFSADQALAFRAAIAHVSPGAPEPLRPARHWAVMPPSNPAAGNQLAASARGLVALGHMVLARGRAAGGERVLSESAVAQMLEPQVPLRGLPGASAWQGLGWRLHRGVAGHGGGAPGVAAELRVAPVAGLAAAVLANSDAGHRFARELLERLFTDLAGMSASPTPVLPDERERVGDTTPYVGRFVTRQTVRSVERDGAGRLWLVDEPRHESVDMARLAGVPARVQRHELRPVTPEVFVVVADGDAAGTVSFLDPGRDGRFGFLAGDRIATRTTVRSR
jgi:CubicO group peptidase (beta-lactamase class C family)